MVILIGTALTVLLLNDNSKDFMRENSWAKDHNDCTSKTATKNIMKEQA